MDSYNDIYENVINEVDNLLTKLESMKEDDDTKQYKNDAINKLTVLQNSLKDSLYSLQSNSDWNTFTIAFYGETNAGKSTLIEALRILLDEPSKVVERNQFFETKAHIDSLYNTCKQLQEKENELVANNEQNDINYLTQFREINEQIDDLTDQLLVLQLRRFYLNQIIMEKMTSSLFSFFKVIFNKLEEQKENKELQNLITSIKKQFDDKIILLSSVKEELLNTYGMSEINISNYKDEMITIQNEIEQTKGKLDEYSDGQIINANNDFTKRMTIYPFKSKNITFNILDLPGIEGKEELVVDEIEKAIERAHVIFYVSKKPHAPQSGKDEDSGTINKIKKQLSTQTEVYFIYNKGIKNPRQLKSELVSADELTALIDTDKQMIAVLDENYKRHISLSAYPAFIALCNSIDDQVLRSKDKFLSAYTKFEILQMSNILSFSKWIEQDLIREYQVKIVKSNFKKIRASINNTQLSIDELHASSKNLLQRITTDFNNVCLQVDEQSNVLVENINDMISKEIDAFINKSRAEGYKKAEQNISNKELTKEFKSVLSNNIANLESNIQNNVTQLCNDYEEELKSIIDQYNDYLVDLTGYFSSRSKINIPSSIKINAKGKGKILGIIGAVAGIVIGIVSTQGILLVLGLISGAISLGKEILGFFDKDYKIGQQKKSINSILSDIRIKIEDELSSNKMDIKSEIDKSAKLIKDELSVSIKIVSDIAHEFESSEKQLGIIKKKIEREEKSYYENN